jgi:hypothetical protein
LRKDPIGLAGGLNLFTYVGNNPILHIDEKGLYVIICRRMAFLEDYGRKNKKWIIRPHSYIYVNGGIFSWHPEALGGITFEENPENNECREVLCCEEEQIKFENCVIKKIYEDIRKEGNFYLPWVRDCTTWAENLVESCWNSVCSMCECENEKIEKKH